MLDSNPGKGKKFFSSPKKGLGRLWGPPSLLLDWYGILLLE
jgi:hypothetical protein